MTNASHIVIEKYHLLGEVAERLKALVLKTSKGATPSWVRIPPLPPFSRPNTGHNDETYPRIDGPYGSSLPDKRRSLGLLPRQRTVMENCNLQGLKDRGVLGFVLGQRAVMVQRDPQGRDVGRSLGLLL